MSLACQNRGGLFLKPPLNFLRAKALVWSGPTTAKLVGGLAIAAASTRSVALNFGGFDSRRSFSMLKQSWNDLVWDFPVIHSRTGAGRLSS